MAEQEQEKKAKRPDDTWRFFRSRIFFLAIALQIIAPLLVKFGNWANIIQYVSGFGMAYALWEYLHVHKPSLKRMEDQMFHLHKKADLLHKKQDEMYEKQRSLNRQQDRMTEKEEVTHQKQDQLNADQSRMDEDMQIH